jgi:hypothetical protein
MDIMTQLRKDRDRLLRENRKFKAKNKQTADNLLEFAKRLEFITNKENVIDEIWNVANDLQELAKELSK